jgi:hypothetical protein
MKRSNDSLQPLRARGESRAEGRYFVEGSVVLSRTKSQRDSDRMGHRADDSSCCAWYSSIEAGSLGHVRPASKQGLQADAVGKIFGHGEKA